MKVAVMKGNKIIETNDNGGEMFMTPPREVNTNTALKIEVAEEKVTSRNIPNSRPIFDNIGLKTTVEKVSVPQDMEIISKKEKEEAYNEMFNLMCQLADEQESKAKAENNIGYDLVRERVENSKPAEVRRDTQESNSVVVEVIEKSALREKCDNTPLVIIDDTSSSSNEEEVEESAEVPVLNEDTYEYDQIIDDDGPEDDIPEDDTPDEEPEVEESNEPKIPPVIFADTKIETEGSSHPVGLSQISSKFIPRRGEN